MGNCMMPTHYAIGICMANVQRSATYEAVLMYELNQTTNAPFFLEIEGAGANADNIRLEKISLDGKLRMIDAGLHYDVLREELKQPAKYIVEKCGKMLKPLYKKEMSRKDLQIIDILYHETRPIVIGLHVAYRNLALQQAGIPKGFMPGMLRQFKCHKGGINLLLPVDEKVLALVQQQTKGRTDCVIRPYGDLVGKPLLEDDLMGGFEAAKRQVQYFMDTRKKALEEMFKLLGSG